LQQEQPKVCTRSFHRHSEDQPRCPSWFLRARSRPLDAHQWRYQSWLGYDANGNITSFRTWRDETLTLTYDNLNRLVSKEVPDRAGLAVTHTRDVYLAYDLFGNMTDARFDDIATGPGNSNTFNALGQMSLVLGGWDVLQGWRTSTAQGMYATTDFAVGQSLSKGGWLGVAGAFGYSLLGGSEGIHSMVKEAISSCPQPAPSASTSP
jgi:YD repeat-containing protein